jgi:hypothetical protein
MKLVEIWRRMFNTKYSALLEVEVARLRAENRALLNSILGIAGVPPITLSHESLTTAPSTLPSLAAESEAKSATASSAGLRGSGRNAASIAAPTRRRSWHQVYRMLEIDSARKKEVT